MTKQTMVVAALLVAACGGSQEPDIMTPEQRLDAQLRLAEEQNAKDDEYNSRYAASESGAEEAAKFDEASAEHELKRATLSAVECPDTMPPEDLKAYRPGTAQLVVTFGNQGEVTDVTIDPAYADTPVGNCVLQAIKPVRIKTFDGPPHKMDWKIELAEPKKKEPAKKEPAKKEPAKKK